MSGQGSYKILFVDDEVNILNALRRTMIDEDWACKFASTAKEGLEYLNGESFDLVMSDVIMPEMGGMDFLSEVRARHPHSIRMFLTGFADKDIVTSALADGYAQQIIPKPWKDEELIEIIRRALKQADHQKKYSSKLQQVLNSMPLLPQQPQSYAKVQGYLSSEEPNLEEIIDFINQDVGLASTILHWANSALFGQRFAVETIQKAIVVIGTDIVVNLILVHSLNQSVAKDIPPMSNFGVEEFNKHSMTTAVMTRLLLKSLRPNDTELHDRGFVAGLLHDLGKLIAAHYFTSKFSLAIEVAKEKNCSLTTAEEAVLGTSHTELGGLLSDWWDLPDFIVNSVRWHHKPMEAPEDTEMVTAVCLADHLSNQLSGERGKPRILDELREQFGLSDESIENLMETAKGILGVHSPG